MKLFSNVPGHDGKLMKIPPDVGMLGRVHYMVSPGREFRPMVIDQSDRAGKNEQLIRVRAASGK
jgi:hypothetical protein